MDELCRENISRDVDNSFFALIGFFVVLPPTALCVFVCTFSVFFEAILVFIALMSHEDPVDSDFLGINFALNIKRYAINIRVVETKGRITDKSYKKTLITGGLHFWIKAECRYRLNSMTATKEVDHVSFGKTNAGSPILFICYDYYDLFGDLIGSEIKSLA